MKLAPYPEYKDSGAPWLGKIPAHWESRKLRNMLTPVSDRNRPDLPLLSVVREKGVIKRNVSSKEENHNFIPDDLSNYKVVLKGQFAMNKMKAWQGSYGVSNLDGIVSPAYFVFDLDGAEGKFFHVAIRSKTYVPFFTQASDGVRVGQWDLNQSRMKEIPFFIPSAEEQTQIACFLGWETAQINKFIRNKRRFIELLKEQKQNVINQAVTRGLDPKVKLKPSGVEWIGDIPEHWEAMRVKFLFAEREERKGDTEFKLLSFSRSKGLVPFAEISSKPPSAEDLSKYKVCRPGHLLMNRMQAWSGMFTDVVIEGVVSPDYSVFEPIRPMSVAYFSYLFKTKRHVDEFAMASKGIGDGFNRLYTPAFGAIRTLCPPVDEQNEIVEFIKQETAIIDVAISRAEQEIELMREYRTRLISDVVTGQVDVRNMKCEGGSLNEDEFEDIEEVEEEIELPEGGEDDE